MNIWEVEERNGIDFSLLHFPAIWLGFWKYFAKTNHSFTSLQDLSCRSLCIYILSKPHFTLLLKMAYVELMVGEMEAYTCVTCIAKSNNESMEMTGHTNWSRLCMCGAWMANDQNKTPLAWILLYFYLNDMRSWLYDFSFFFLDILVSNIFPSFWSCFFGTPSFLSRSLCVMFLWHAIFPLSLFFFFYSPCLIWRIIWRERSFSWILRNGWNGIANF